MTDKRWLIWSNEHGAWWAPDRMGYTNTIVAAGRYTREAAEAIVAGASAGLGVYDTAPEVMTLAPEWAGQQPEPSPREVTEADYAAAVATLAETASHITSGGRAAAQVLLSTYNGRAFHMDLTDLCLLDAEHLDAALTVLRGRAVLRREPHTCIEDGDALFRRLWELWGWLHVKQRYEREYR